jgi:glucose/arabinose dehydrogenase
MLALGVCAMLVAAPRVRAADAHAAPNGVVRDGKVYRATPTDVLVAEIRADGRLGRFRPAGTHLPDIAQHAIRAIFFAPDGLLDIQTERGATEAAGSPTGCRAEYAWDPATGDLWCRSLGLTRLQAEPLPLMLSHAVLSDRAESANRGYSPRP